jgi:ferrous iron transport protein A
VDSLADGVARRLLLSWRTKLKAIFNFVGKGVNKLRKNEKQSSPEPKESGSLDTLPSGLAARVVNVQGSSAIARRLMEMGIVPGAPIRVVRTAPLGDPIQVCLRDYHLALRRAEARAITVLVGI